MLIFRLHIIKVVATDGFNQTGFDEIQIEIISDYRTPYLGTFMFKKTFSHSSDSSTFITEERLFDPLIDIAFGDRSNTNGDFIERDTNDLTDDVNAINSGDFVNGGYIDLNNIEIVYGFGSGISTNYDFFTITYTSVRH